MAATDHYGWRTLRRTVGALCLTLALVFGGAPVAYPLIATEFDPAIGDAGEVKLSVDSWHTPTANPSQGRDAAVERGVPFHMWTSYKISQLTPGTAQEIEISLAISSKVTLQDPITRASFNKTNDPRIEVSSVTCDDTGHQCTATVTIAADYPYKTAEVRYHGVGTVPQPEGTPQREIIYNSGSASMQAVTDIGLSEGQPRYFAPDVDNQCAGTFNFEWHLTNGAWLADIKFADAEGQGKITLDSSPLTADNPRSQITVRDSGGQDITDQVLSGMTWYGSDSSAPYRTDNLVSQLYPNARWLMSANWNFDVANYTGDTWLPAGSTVTVSKYGTHSACFSGFGLGFAADYDSTRPVGVALEVARPVMPVEAFGYDQFTLEGEGNSTPAVCENTLVYNEENTTRNPMQDFGYIDGAFNDKPYASHAVNTTRVYNRAGTRLEGGRWRSIAVHESHPNRWYTMATTMGSVNNYQNGLYYYDTETQKYHYVGTSGYPQNLRSSQAYGLGFDADGYLWIVYSTDTPPVGGVANPTGATNVFYRLDVFNGATQWEKMATIRTPPFYGTYYDVAFDTEGNAYVLTNGLALNNQLREGKIIMIDAQTIRTKNSTIEGLFTYGRQIATVGEGSNWHGIAWGPDGQLYVGQTNRGIYRVDPRNGASEFLGAPTENRITSSSFKFPVVDLSTCLYGQPVSPGEEPGFRLEKSVVDPHTGEIVAPGQAATHPVELDANGRARIRYVFTVTNTHDVAADPGTVTDNAVLPEGFKLTGLAVQPLRGAEQTVTTGTRFTVSPGQIPAKGAVSYLVTMDVRAAADRSQVDWSSAETCGDMSGSRYGGGFFNQVSMPDDADGVENNHGCVPVKPPSEAHLRLTKVIEMPDGSGVVGTGRETDTQYFTLVASRDQGGDMITGSSPASGETAASGQVLAGTYRLSEHPAAVEGVDEKLAGYTFGTSWHCMNHPESRDPQEVPVSDANTIEVNADDDIACTIVNTPKPAYKIEKLAATPAEVDNPHIGQPVQIDATGKVSVDYRIRVTNLTDHRITVGPILEKFVPPAGLVWDESETPRVWRADDDGDESTITGLAKAAELAPAIWSEDGVKLADSVTLVPVPAEQPQGKTRGSVDIGIRLFLEADRTPGKTNSSVFADHQDSLSTCVAGEKDGQKYAQTTSGIVNRVYMAGEDQHYSPIWSEDNIACIPVTPPQVPDLPELPLTGGKAKEAYWIVGSIVLLGGAAAAMMQRRRRKSVMV